MLIEHTSKGLYVPQAKVYIDPWRKVSNALITHGHSDHARWGHKYYVCATPSVPILRHRLGHNINVRGIDFGSAYTVNGVRFSFHPAGHILGSAQIRVEYKGEVWVVTGDYKTENDGISGAFELVTCHHFITECTFGLPVYKWQPQEVVIQEIKEWWQSNAEEGRPSVITAYALGKAQRIIHALGRDAGTIYTHGAIHQMNEVYRSLGVNLPPTYHMNAQTTSKDLAQALIVTPGSAVGTAWIKKAKGYVLGVASGWMAVRGQKRRRGADQGFTLSDHCDWDALNTVIKDTGATHVYPTHGYTDTFARWLRGEGYEAQPIETDFGTAEEDVSSTSDGH